TARCPESMTVLEAFMQTEMAQGCALLSRAELATRAPQLCAEQALGALYSPHEIRVESRTAIPRLTHWLAQAHGVTFMTGTAVHEVAPPRIVTSRGVVEAEAAIVCPGDDFVALFPERIAAYAPRKCILTMLRLADPGFRLPAALMSDLGLVRYKGYADLPEAAGIKARAARDHAEALAHGIHLIVVQSADGSLVVGDSHHYDDTPWPFMDARSEALILEEFKAATGLTPPPVIERWTGIYASSDQQDFFIDAPAPATRIVMVTTGAGASMSFGLAEQVIGELYD
ncbi:MAG: TIGR03364 family FAD-dependent oxidoreductase, partial [Alphaproteobacteria bacterium]|nr:TIGR03364 family FAD-dependent oxidoreductase [Alphaproteobacteria bacterium]